jgi:hypothetical protein
MGGFVQPRPTDDDLFRAIADNTDALSVLIEQQMALDAGLGEPDPDSRASRMLSNVQLINAYQRDYRRIMGEIRRRHPGV